MDIGVKCLGTHPRKTEKQNAGRKSETIEVSICCAPKRSSVKISHGDYNIVADMDGVIVVPRGAGANL
ncbi:unnamed protein product [Amoebophrya sp. A25]|nr:unnamed protein product [Amoebophrya sp. A25]|eukprot:GSA25T00019340001.1